MRNSVAAEAAASPGVVRRQVADRVDSADHHVGEFAPDLPASSTAFHRASDVVGEDAAAISHIAMPVTTPSTPV
jgi:hypothetical protein